MTNFDRSFAGLERLNTGNLPAWWCDLLRYWIPSGLPSGDRGRRLAVRNGSLNFYRRGQSVARVTLENGALKAEVHEKYALEPDEQPEGRYLVLDADGAITRQGNLVRHYNGAEMLNGWIARAEEYAGAEKSFVDRLVAANANVIDPKPSVMPLQSGHSTLPTVTDYVVPFRSAC